MGQTVSSIGSWSQSLAVIWLVLDLTNRSDRLGVATALQFLPVLLLGAQAGVLADRLDNRRLLLATSTVSGLLAVVFGVMVTTDRASIWWIYALTMLLGVVLALERPVMQAILFQLVGPELLPGAVAANSTINSVSRLVGPAIAGALIAWAGVGACFFVNAASYLVVIGALLALRADELVPRPLVGRARGRLREGLAYVRARPEVARPLVVMTIMGTVAYNFQTTFPSMVRFGFDRGAGGVSAVMSVSAVGSILGGVYIAGVVPHARRTLAVTLVAFAAAFAVVAAAPGFWAFVAVSVPLGFASASFQSVNTVVLQQATEPAMQGRVMALHQMAWFGTTPVGAVLMGWIIQATSPRVPFALGGVAALGCAALAIGRRSSRIPAPGDATRAAGF